MWLFCPCGNGLCTGIGNISPEICEVLMIDSSRAKWLEVLDMVSHRRPDEAEAEWAWVMEQLELGPEYFLAIYEAVRQGGWREAENPAGYIKKVAQREKHREAPDGSRGRRGLKGMRGFQGLEAAGE